MLTEELLRMIAASPRAFLRRNYRTEEQIGIKRRRIETLWRASTATTQTLKAVVAYTGPGDKVGNAAVEIAALCEELENDAAALAGIQRETAEAIERLVPDKTQRMILEAYYLSHMRWEEIAVTMHYAYRWTMRLHQKALRTMQAEAEKLLQPVQDRREAENEKW